MEHRLEKDGLVLVPLNAKYEQFYIDLANNPAIREKVNNSIPYLKEHFLELLHRDEEKPHHHVWVIEEKGAAIGAITFGPLKSHPQIFQGGYWLDPSAWGRGIAAQAVALVSDFLMKHCSAQRIQAVVEPDNTASMKVLEKCGYKNEGLLSKFYPSKYRGLVDVYMYARVAP